MRENILLVGVTLAVWVAVGPIVPSVLAQEGHEQLITGMVSDQSGAIVPGADVLITNQATGVSIEAKSNSDGLYRSPAMINGQYSVRVSKEGFETLVRTGIELHTAEIMQLDVQLKVGSTTQLVQVNGAAPLLTTTDARLGETITQQAVTTMPLLDRRAGGLIGLAPGVYYEGQDAESYYTPRYNLGNSDQAQISVDGANAGGGRMAIEGQMSSPNPSVDAIQEVQVQTGYESPEYGTAVGGMIRMVTKSGTDQYHGSLYEDARSSIFDTRAFFAPKKQADHYNVFGGTVGGPIKKDKLFFFGSVEISRMALPTGGAYTIPTASMIGGNFSAIAVPIYDPLTTRPDPSHPGQFIRDQFPDNIIPPGRIDPVAAAALSYLPQVTTPGTNNFDAIWDSTINRRAWTGKVDYQMGPNDQWAFTWLYDRTNENIGGVKGFKDPAAIPEFAADSFPYQMQSFAVQETHSFSPSLINSFQTSYRPRWWYTTPPGWNPAAQWGAKLGIKNTAEDVSFPPFYFGGYMHIGPGFANYSQNPINNEEFADSLTYVRGKHTLKAGLQFERERFALDGRWTANGSYNFDNRLTDLPGNPNTGDAAASFVLGAVSSASMLDMGQLSYRQWYAATYIQDDFRVRRNLTVNFGLRWDIDFPQYEDVGNKISGFDPYSINPVSNTPGIVTYVGHPGQPPGMWYTDWRRVNPRFGFAYSINDKTVFRGAYGWFGAPPTAIYGQGSGDLGIGPASNSFSTSDNGLTPAFWLQDGLPPWQRGGTSAVENSSFGAVPVGHAPIASPQFVDPRWNFGYTQNANLSIGRELPGQILIELAGIASLGRRLPMSFNLNQVPPESWGTPGNAQGLRPFPQFGNVTSIASAQGTTNYYGATWKLTKRFSHGLLLDTSFTWQKQLGVTGFQDNSDHKLSYGDASTSLGVPTPERMFKFSWSYDLPAGPGKKYLTSGPGGWILGGWNLGGIGTLVSGETFAITSPSDSLNCYCGAGLRVNQIGNLKAQHQSTSQWFNTAAVAFPAFGTIGTLGGDNTSLRGPDFPNLDLALSKTTRFKERYALRFMASAFNSTNSVKLGNPDSTLGDANFGVISGYRGLGSNGGFFAVPWYGARIMQLGMRLTW